MDLLVWTFNCSYNTSLLLLVILWNNFRVLLIKTKILWRFRLVQAFWLIDVSFVKKYKRKQKSKVNILKSHNKLTKIFSCNHWYTAYTMNKKTIYLNSIPFTISIFLLVVFIIKIDTSFLTLKISLDSLFSVGCHG